MQLDEVTVENPPRFDLFANHFALCAFFHRLNRLSEF
jgi:hypothetical protein